MSENGTASSIQRSSSSSRTRARRKPKKNQIPIGILVLIGIAVIGILLSLKTNNTFFLFWITGIAFGFILQKARFCFTASMRDPYLTGSTSVTRAVLIAFAITTIGFTAIKYGYFKNGLPIPGMGMWYLLV